MCCPAENFEAFHSQSLLFLGALYHQNAILPAQKHLPKGGEEWGICGGHWREEKRGIGVEREAKKRRRRGEGVDSMGLMMRSNDYGERTRIKAR